MPQMFMPGATGDPITMLVACITSTIIVLVLFKFMRK